MTLKYMEGFETSRADSDLRTRGYMYSTAAYMSAMVPSVTGLAGYACAGFAPAIGNTTQAQFNGANSTYGVWTGTSVNQAWTAGGFTVGFSATANCSAITGRYYGYAMGVGSTANSNQICFDGSLYWAIGVSGSTFSVFTSPDMKTWTPTPSQPTGGLDALTPISYMGGGVVAVGRMTTASTTYTIYYTSNQGSSWSSQVLLTGTSSANYTTGIATGNSTYPNACYTSGTSTTNGVYVGTLGGTMTQVVSSTVTPAALARPKLTGGLIVFMGSTASGAGAIYTATASNASLNTTGAWSTATFTGINSVNDIVYNPTSNLWVIAGATGIWTIPNTGSVGTAVALTGAVTGTQRYSTVAMQNIFWTGTQLVATGLSGHVITSPDGVTWTEQGQKILPVGTSGYNYSSAIYDGSQYVICTDATTGLVCTSSDGVNNWQATYASHKTPTTVNSTSPNMSGIWFTGITAQPANPVGSALTAPSAGETFFGFNIASVTAAGSLTAYVTRVSTSPYSATLVYTNTFSGVVTTPAQATHYYEMIFTSVAGTTNMFNVTINIDGVTVYTQANVQPIATADTTAQIILTPLPANQNVAQIDDLYFCFNDGSGVSGAQGTVNIAPQRPTTDVSTAWVKNGSAASNSLSVNQSALSSLSTNYVSSAVAGDKDVYSSSNVVPAGYTAKAIQHEAYFTRTSSSSPMVSVGVSSGGVEADSPNVTLPSGTTFVSQSWDKNPNGSVAWNNTTVAAAQFVINHVT